MPFPSLLLPDAPTADPQMYGIGLSLYAADPAYRVEIQRAPDLAGAPDVGNAATIDTVPGTQRTYFDQLPNDGLARWYRLRSTLDGETPSAWTVWVRGVPAPMPLRLEQAAPILPAIREQFSESATTGTLTLLITDPQGRVTLVETKTKSGSGAETAYAAVPDAGGGTYPTAVALAAKQTSRITYRISGYDALGRLVVLAEAAVSFSVGTTPGMPTIVATVSGTGAVTATVTGDSDTQSVRVAASTAGTPSDAATRAAAALNGRVVTTGVLLTLSPGQRCSLAAFAYNGAGGAGQESAKATAVADMGTVLLAGPPRAVITTTATSRTSETVAYSGTLGLSGVGPLEYRKRVIDDTAARDDTIGWTAWSQSVPAAEVVTRDWVRATRVELEVRDAGAGAIVSPRATRVVTPNFPGLMDTGILDRRTAVIDSGVAESFDGAFPGRRWKRKAGTGTAQVVQVADAQFGGRVLRVSGGEAWYEWADNIPFDPAILYQITIRVRQTVAPSVAGTAKVYCGVAGIAADGVTYVNTAGANSYATQHYFAASSIDLVAGAGWQSFTGYFQGTAGAGAGGQRADARNPGQLYTGCAYFRPLFIVNYADGDGTAEIDVIVLPIHGATAAAVIGDEGRRRIDTYYSDDGVLAAGVQQTDGVTGRPILKGRRSGLVRHGVSVVFDQPFQSAPMVLLRGGLVAQPDASKWGTAAQVDAGGPYAGGYDATKRVYSNLDAMNVDAAGFDVVARLRQKASGTTVVHDEFPTSNALFNIGDSTAAVTSHAPASDNKYTVHYRVSIDATPSLIRVYSSNTISVEIAIDTVIGGVPAERIGFIYSSTWRDGQAYSAPTWTETQQITVSGLSATDAIRVRIKNITYDNDPGTVSAHGMTGSAHGDPADGLDYTTAVSSDLYTNATPDPEDTISYDAIAAT